MTDETVANIPVEVAPYVPPFAVGSLPVSLQIFFNDDLFDRCKAVAQYLAKAEGMAPRHLIGKPEACFAVVSRALTWRLDPYAVAMATYQTPGGQVGFYGSLCQAIIENSGRLEGGVRYEHYGDWEKVRGKFRIQQSEKGTKYPVPNWKSEDEAGLGVLVSAKMKGEEKRREMRFDLIQAFPRNSTLWATDPHTQIQYTAVRRFATSTVPTLFMGVPFDSEEVGDWATQLHDVTPPRPVPEEPVTGRRTRIRRGGGEVHAIPAQETNAQSADEKSDNAQPNGADPAIYFFVDPFGEVREFSGASDAVDAFAHALDGTHGNLSQLEAYWENGAILISALRENGYGGDADMLGATYAELVDLATAAVSAGEAEPAEATAEAPPEETASQAPSAPPAQGFDVAVPVATGQSTSQWHMAARSRLKEMGEAGCQPEDYRRFREVNKGAMDKLQTELRSWWNMLDKEIAKGANTT